MVFGEVADLVGLVVEWASLGLDIAGADEEEVGSWDLPFAWGRFMPLLACLNLFLRAIVR